MVNEAVAVPEFSRPLQVDQVGSAELVREIAATQAERAALAERLDLVSLDLLEAVLRLRRLASGVIEVKGRLAADVVQTCVVTMAPVAQHCSEEFTMLFGGRAEQPARREVEIEPAGADEPEPIVEGRIDLGEAVVQQLAVSLDPYPRAPGARLPDLSGEGEPARDHPFAALQRLRGGTQGDR